MSINTPQSATERTALFPDSMFAEEEPRKAPRDFLGIAFIFFFIQGMGVLFPWNAFISAPDFFM